MKIQISFFFVPAVLFSAKSSMIFFPLNLFSFGVKVVSAYAILLTLSTRNEGHYAPPLSLLCEYFQLINTTTDASWKLGLSTTRCLGQIRSKHPPLQGARLVRICRMSSCVGCCSKTF